MNENRNAIAAATDRGWRNALTELAEWCDEQALQHDNSDPWPTPAARTYKLVAEHARERAQ